jgi:hypothetical protein
MMKLDAFRQEEGRAQEMSRRINREDAFWRRSKRLVREPLIVRLLA